MTVNKISESLSNAEKLKEELDTFRKGSKTLSKEDLQNIKTNSQSITKSSTALDEVINNYDKIDINGDGISLTELQTFYTAKGTLSNYVNQSNTSFWQESFGNSKDKERKNWWNQDEEDEDGYFTSTDYSSYPSSSGLSQDLLLEIRNQITASGASVPEELNQLLDNFSDADTDQDGTISLEDYQAFLAKINA